MLLSRASRRAARRDALRDDRGGALVAVVGIAAVMMVFVLAGGSLLVGSLRYSDSTRAAVQAQAAGQAGVAATAVDLTKGTCAAPYSRTTTPRYSVTVAYQRTATGTTWLAGCPSSATDVSKVKIVSVGSATASSTVTRTVEAIYDYIPYNPGQTLVGSGAAVYGFDVTDGTITNLTINQSGSHNAGIEFKSGDASCQTGGVIQGDVILGSGVYRSPSGCTINGDLWASETVSVGNNSRITGNVHASGTTSPVVSVANGAVINGSVTSSGPVQIAGSVGGSVIAGPRTGASSVSGSVGGTFTTAGTVSVSGSGLPSSRISQRVAGIVPPTPPVVPDWVDFAYNRNDWLTAAGTPYAEVVPTSCAGPTVTAALNAATTPTIVYASARCPGGMVSSFDNLTLKTDAVLIADAFDLKNMTIASAAGTGTHRLSIITPDAVRNQQPDCPSALDSKIENQVVTSSAVPVSIYTPCKLSNSGSTWWGQVYARSIAFNNSFTLNFVPLGLPGVDFDEGTYTPPTPPVPGHLGDAFSVRNISG